MTDKLTPPTWTELAESIRWLDGKISRQSEVGYLLRGLIASFETEAARREAEAKPNACEHDWLCRPARPCVCLRCGATATTPVDHKQPEAPATADDLAERLRDARPTFLLNEQAAERIEALQAENARLREAIRDIERAWDNGYDAHQIGLRIRQASVLAQGCGNG